MANLRMLFKLWGVYGKLDLTWLLRDTRYCLICIFSDLIGSVTGVFFGVFALAQRFGGIGGMEQGQLLWMLGYALMADGLFQMCFCAYNIGHMSRIIGRGQLDHMLIQPVPLWIQILGQGLMPFTGSSAFICGAGLTLWAARQLGMAITLPGILVTGLFALASASIIYFASLWVSCAAFAAPLAAEEISMEITGIFRNSIMYPLGGLSRGLQKILCTALPIGLCAWLPSGYLLGLPLPGVPGWLVLVVALLMGMAASLTFKKGLKHYAKYGSQRYVVWGHRR